MNDIRILARFISADSLAPFNRMKAVLWDRDPVSNDMLGDSALDDSGCVVFQFNLAAASSIDSPGEVNPDIYIQILLDTVEVFELLSLLIWFLVERVLLMTFPVVSPRT
jgi:hypothetical protein